MGGGGERGGGQKKWELTTTTTTSFIEFRKGGHGNQVGGGRERYGKW